jgi:hypothetical protein
MICHLARKIGCQGYPLCTLPAEDTQLQHMEVNTHKRPAFYSGKSGFSCAFAGKRHYDDRNDGNKKRFTSFRMERPNALHPVSALPRTVETYFSP